MAEYMFISQSPDALLRIDGTQDVAERMIFASYPQVVMVLNEEHGITLGQFWIIDSGEVQFYMNNRGCEKKQFNAKGQVHQYPLGRTGITVQLADL